MGFGSLHQMLKRDAPVRDVVRRGDGRTGHLAEYDR